MLQCPKCHITKVERISDELLANRQKIDKEILAIFIPKNTTCNHEFLVFLDKNFIVRDSEFITDIEESIKNKTIQLESIAQLFQPSQLEHLNPNNI